MSDYDNTQGRCARCNVRHTWPKRLHGLAGSACPDCGTPLLRTARTSTLPRKHWPSGLGVTYARLGESADPCASEQGAA